MRNGAAAANVRAEERATNGLRPGDAGSWLRTYDWPFSAIAVVPVL